MFSTLLTILFICFLCLLKIVEIVIIQAAGGNLSKNEAKSTKSIG